MSSKIVSTIELNLAQVLGEEKPHRCIESAFIDAVRPFVWDDSTDAGFEIAFHCAMCHQSFSGRIRSITVIPDDLVYFYKEQLIVPLQNLAVYFPQIERGDSDLFLKSIRQEIPPRCLSSCSLNHAHREGLELSPDFKANMAAFASYCAEPV
jgi:hypothetical protein